MVALKRIPRDRLAFLLVVSVTAFMALRMASYTAVFAANMMYWDQWDFYARLFTNSDLFQIFRYQHGPHRQGLGGLLIALVAALTNWDSRGDSAREYSVGFRQRATHRG